MGRGSTDEHGREQRGVLELCVFLARGHSSHAPAFGEKWRLVGGVAAMGGKAPAGSACSRGTRPRRLLPWVPREKERLELGAPAMERTGGDAMGGAVPRRRAEVLRILGVQEGSPDLGKSRGEGPAWSASMEKKLLRCGRRALLLGASAESWVSSGGMEQRMEMAAREPLRAGEEECPACEEPAGWLI
jgi:hypothetical protein